MIITSNNESRPFDFIEWAPEISRERQKRHELEQERIRQAEQAPLKPRNIDVEGSNIIQMVNQVYQMIDVIDGDYIDKGNGKLLYRGSTSGNPGARIFYRDGKEVIYDWHESSQLSQSKHSGHAHDVFGALCELRYGGDVQAAVRDQAPIVDPEGQKRRQQEYMRQQEATINQHPTAPEPKRLTISFTHCFDICQEQMRQEFIIDGLIAEGDQVIITGDGGIGKSTIAFHIAHYLATSRNLIFDQFEIPKPRTSLFLNSENSKIQINSRLNNMVGNNPEAREALKRLYAPIVHGDVLTCGKSFDDPIFRQWVVDLVHSIEDYQGSKLDLIWIDPLISFISCDENAAAEMRKNLDGITEVSQMCKVTPIVIHHNKKDGGGYRGSSAIRDWTRNLIELNRTFVAQTRLIGDGLSRQAKIPCIHVRHEKCNNFQMFESFTLRMMPDQTFKPIEENLTPEKAEQGGMVKQALTDLGGMASSTNELSKVYQELAGIGHTAAKKHIRAAVDHKFIDRFSMLEKGKQVYKYSLPDGQNVSNRVVT